MRKPNFFSYRHTKGIFVAKLIAFVFLLALVLDACGTIMDGGKSSTENSSSLQHLPRHSIDVLWLGSSHVYAGVIPQYLYDLTGIPSAMASGHGLDINASYWQLKEVLRKQSPKVVVVDVFGAGGPYVYSESMSQTIMRREKDLQPGGFPYNTTTSAARWIPILSPNKIPAILDAYRLTKIQGEAYFSLTNVHDSYFEIKRKNFDFFFGNNSCAPGFGYKYLSGVTPEEMLEPFPFGEEQERQQLYYYWSFTDDQLEKVQLEDFIIYDLQRLMDLSKESDFELVLCAIPYFANDAERLLFDQVQQMAEENGVSFVGLDDVVIDEPSLFDDMGHLNFYGAQINTEFWAEYLTENFDLPDRRESKEIRYSAWRKGEGTHAQPAMADQLNELETLTETLEMVSMLNDDYIIALMIEGDVYEGFSYDDYDLLIEMGVDEQAVDEWFNTGTGIFTAILNDGKMLQSHFDPDSTSCSIQQDVDGFLIEMKNNSGELGWKINGSRPSYPETGLNIAVFCKSSEHVPYARCFDLTEIYFEE